MDLLQITFTTLNVISLLLLGVGYFKSKFTLVDLETYNALLEVAEEYAEMKENENSGGGIGFFYDQLPQEEEEIEEEE